MLNHNKNAPPAQLSPQLFSSQQRSAVRCRAVPCGVVPCPAVRSGFMLRCAFFRTYSSTRHMMRSTRYRYVRVSLSSFSCFFFKVDCPLSVRMPHPPPTNYTRTADQNVTLPTSTQHSAHVYSSAQAALGIINSLVAPNHGPLLSVPFPYVLVAFFLARAKRAASAARIVYLYNLVVRDVCSRLHRDTS